MSKPKSRRPRRVSGSSANQAVDRSSVDDSGGRKKLSFAVLLSGICSVALLLRLVNVLQTVEMPTVVQLLGDAKGYYDWASRIAGGQWYGSETFYQAPLYPYFLAVQMKMFGSDVLGFRLLQAILGAASVFLLGLAGRNVFDAKAGLIAAAMYAVYPPAIYYDGIIQKTSLASFLLCVLLALCAALAARGSKRSNWRLGFIATGLGATLGLLMLTRENAILWTPVFPVWIWLGFDQPRRHRLATIGLYLVGLALVLLPVAARNASLGGEWSPTTFQAGPNFYIGNNLGSNGLYRPLVPGHETPMYERADAERLAEQAEGRDLTSREVSKFWFSRSWEEIRQAPLRWVQLVALKSLMVINRYEVPDVESMYVYRDYSWPLRLVGPVWHFGFLCPLAVWGIVVTRQQWRSLWIYYLLILVMAAAVIGFFILGRYRQPLVPLLALFAGAGLLDLGVRIRGRDWSRSLVAVSAALITLVACNIKIHDESMLDASSYMNLGIAAGQAGNMAVSIDSLAHAVRSHPEMPEAHVNLGRALDLSNRLPEAIECYRNALSLDPNLVMVDSLLGSCLERAGDRENALQHYRRAIEIDPQDAQARQALEQMLGRNPSR